MSFGLLTAISLEDVPRVLKRCAVGWRGGVYKKYPQAWLSLADEIDRYAEELKGKIEELKKNEPKVKRPRVML